MSQFTKLSSLITFLLLSFLALSPIGYSRPVSTSSASISQSLQARRIIPDAGALLDTLFDDLRFNDPKPANNERAQPESDNNSVINHSIKKATTYSNSHNSTAKDANGATEQKQQQDKNLAKDTINFLGRFVETLGHDPLKGVDNSDEGKLI